MKRFKLFAITLLCLINLSIYSQESKKEITGEEWDKLIQLLSADKWNDAEKLSLKYLNKFNDKDDSLADPAIVRYMYIRCVAAKLGNKVYDKDEAVKKVAKFIGKPIITPPRTFNQECMFNCLRLTEDKKCMYSCSSNDLHTVIHDFERYEMADTTFLDDVSAIEGKDIRIAAFVKTIDAGGYAMPRLEIVFETAFVWDEGNAEGDDNE